MCWLAQFLFLLTIHRFYLQLQLSREQILQNDVCFLRKLIKHIVCFSGTPSLPLFYHLFQFFHKIMTSLVIITVNLFLNCSQGHQVGNSRWQLDNIRNLKTWQFSNTLQSIQLLQKNTCLLLILQLILMFLRPKIIQNSRNQLQVNIFLHHRQGRGFLALIFFILKF